MKNLSIAVTAILLLGTLIAFYPNSQPKSILNEYREYMTKFNKVHSTPEEIFYRAAIYNKFLTQMKAHNEDNTKTWKMGVNQFSDLTDEEFVATFLGEKPSDIKKEIKVEDVNSGFTATVDWRTQGIITPIRNQGQCGSCWAFASTAAHETYQIQNRHQSKDINLSEQQLVDCATAQPYGNEGCNGGYAVRALEYIKDFGQTTEAAYPYKAVNQQCQTPTGSFRTYGVAELAGCAEIEYQIQRSPMAVRVDATNWKTYASGIFNNCDKKINHAVFLVGSSDESWTIKNSWSPAWGEQGYIRLAKGDTCAVCQGPSFPI